MAPGYTCGKEGYIFCNLKPPRTGTKKGDLYGVG